MEEPTEQPQRVLSAHLRQIKGYVNNEVGDNHNAIIGINANNGNGEKDGKEKEKTQSKDKYKPQRLSVVAKVGNVKVVLPLSGPKLPPLKTNKRTLGLVSGVEGDYASIKIQGPATAALKATYQKQIRDKERARAVAYRKSVGRRNALDLGNQRDRRRASRTNEQPNPRSQSVMDPPKPGNYEEKRSKSSLAKCDSTQFEKMYAAQIEKFKDSGLTLHQIKAFKEVFDLFDRNGGGSIDANELSDTLKSVGIVLTTNQIYDVLKFIDKDGNGEIDFEEFLQIMTNTERFIESLSKAKETVDGREKSTEEIRCETLLFDALTEFMKKSALHSMDEIVDYYSHTYKKTQTPHVVNHYAAGARLIGLTERQLKAHLETLKANRIESGTNNEVNSPYNMPLYIISSSTSLRPMRSGSRYSNNPRKHGRIKLFVKISEEKSTGEEAKRVKRSQGGDNLTNGVMSHGNVTVGGRFLRRDKYGLGKLHHMPLAKRGFGWVGQYPEYRDVKLLSEPLRELVPFHALTAEDLPRIRSNVEAATVSCSKARRRLQLEDSYKHWNALEANLIHPKILQKNFIGTYSIYSLVSKKNLKL